MTARTREEIKQRSSWRSGEISWNQAETDGLHQILSFETIFDCFFIAPVGSTLTACRDGNSNAEDEEEGGLVTNIRRRTVDGTCNGLADQFIRCRLP